MQRKIVILGTGGTIAGTAASAADAVGYTAAQLGVAQLVAAVPPLAQLPIECEQVAQLDSKDMDLATWQRLAQRAAHHLARADVAGVVVTHGTDTLEETAYFLHRVLAPAKPLVLTAAMRPATSLQADGPQNLLDAVTLARDGRVPGVSVVHRRPRLGRRRRAQGAHLPARCLRRRRCRAAGADRGRAGARAVPARACGGRSGCARPGRDRAEPASWPRVEIVLNHAGSQRRARRCTGGAEGRRPGGRRHRQRRDAVRRSKPRCGAPRAAVCACCAPAAVRPARCRAATAPSCRAPVR